MAPEYDAVDGGRLRFTLALGEMTSLAVHFPRWFNLHLMEQA